MSDSLFKRLSERDLCFTIRKADRKITKLYDFMLRQFGLRSTQLFILLAFYDEELQKESMSYIANVLEMDRTTLTRNMIPIIRAGFVCRVKSKDFREKSYELTEKGRQAIDDCVESLEWLQEFFYGVYEDSYRGFLDNILRSIDVIKSVDSMSVIVDPEE